MAASIRDRCLVPLWFWKVSVESTQTRPCCCCAVMWVIISRRLPLLGRTEVRDCNFSADNFVIRRWELYRNGESINENDAPFSTTYTPELLFSCSLHLLRLAIHTCKMWKSTTNKAATLWWQRAWKADKAARQSEKAAVITLFPLFQGVDVS